MDIGSVLLSRNVPVIGVQAQSGTGKSNFLSQVQQAQQARMAPVTKDTVSLSNRNYEATLARLKELHKNTDYSGMSGKEIVRLVHSRFEEAFPNYGAIAGGFYLCAGVDSIYEKIRWEEEAQYHEALNGDEPWKTDPGGVRGYLRYVFGYDGLSNDEIMDKLHEKYAGGTLADRYAMAWEMLNMGLGDPIAAGDIMDQVHTEMIKGTERQYGNLFRDNPIRVSAMISYGEGTTISWTQLAKNLVEERQNWRYESETIKKHMLAELETRLDSFLDTVLGSKRTKSEDFWRMAVLGSAVC